VAQRLEAAELSAGERFLADETGVAAELAGLRSELDLIERGLGALNVRARAAERDRKIATVADLRREAREKRVELSHMEAKSARLLAALSELEGTEYTACILGYQRAGLWITFDTHVDAATEPWRCPGECGADVLNNAPFARPKSREIRDQILRLEGEALMIESELDTPPAELPAPAVNAFNAKPYGPEIFETGPSAGHEQRLTVEPSIGGPPAAEDKPLPAPAKSFEPVSNPADPFYRDTRREEPRGLWGRE
jgi:hypothetical protein